MHLPKDVSPTPSVPTDRNQPMVSAPRFAIMDSSSMRVSASMEDASLVMPITDSEDAPGPEAHPFSPALLEGSNSTETAFPTAETDSSLTISARSVLPVQPTVCPASVPPSVSAASPDSRPATEDVSPPPHAPPGSSSSEADVSLPAPLEPTRPDLSV